MRFVQIFLTLLILPFFCIGQTSEQFMDIAKNKLESKDFNYALNSIQKSIEIDSMDIWNRMLHAEILLELNRVREAEIQLQKAVQINSMASEPYNRLGNLYLSLNELENSLTYFSKAIEYAESDTIAISYYINSATAKGVLRDFEGSIKDFESAYTIDSIDPIILNNLATIYEEVGRVNDGVIMLKKLIKLNPEFIGPYVNLGLIYSENDSLDLSEFYFNKALEINPKEPILLNNKGYLHYKKKEYEVALKLINESIDLFPNNSYAYRNRALVYFELELNYEACKDLEIATYYNFSDRYGDEVENLYKERCEKD